MQEKLQGAGTFAAWQSPEQMGARMSRDYEKWGKVIKEKNIEID